MLNQSNAGIGWPRHVVLGITSRCNYRCATCNPHRHDDRNCSADRLQYNDMPDAVFFRLEDLFRNARIISMGGVGEPTISADFIERTRWLRSLNPQVLIAAFTNGSTLGSTQAAENIARAVDYLHVSVSGLANYDDVMVDGSLKATLGNLARLRDVRRRTGRPQRLELGVVLMRSNIDDLVQLAELARDMEFDRIAFKDLWVFDKNIEAESIRHDSGLAERARINLAKARKAGIPMRCEPWPELSTTIVRPGHIVRCAVGAIRTGHLWPTHETFSYWFRFSKEHVAARLRFRRQLGSNRNPKIRPACRYPWEMAQVTECGNVLLCCAGLTELGSIEHESFWSVWTGETASAYRNGMLTGEHYGACKNCKYVSTDSSAFVREHG